MELQDAIARVRLGESIAAVRDAYRADTLHSMGMTEHDVGPQTLRKESHAFTRKLCRALGDKCAGERKVGSALRDWVESVTDYEAWDALLSGFDFEGKKRLIERGRRLFAGPMTAHWDG
jgi:hypothetical protein